ncbi:MAG: MraY family glycosyltransferase [Phycisphaerae bacterium]|jgi:UDP-GlcNAc:undecaprenyl-phosphate GlcNAc-1-phosphate transferase
MAAEEPIVVLKYTAVEVLRDKWWIAMVALGIALVATPIVRAIAYRARIVDRPDDLLKPHGRPVAYLGGLAICLGLLAGLACHATLLPLGQHWCEIRRGIAARDFSILAHNPLWNIMAIALSGILITITGLVDDLCNITPRQKICGQIAAAGVLLLGGIGTGMISMFLAPLGIVVPLWLLLILRTLFCLLLVICACNATNLLDGLDGLCGGVTGIIALGYLALAVFLAMFGRVPEMDGLRVGLCLAMVGAVLGFLPYNIPPASIFMGDAGSMLLGFFVATMMAMFCHEASARWFLAACVVFALPILDTALAVVRRTLSGTRIFSGDRSHLYDQLVDRGMSVKQVVVLFYALSILAGAIGVLSAIFLRLRYAVVLYALGFAAIWVLFYKLGMVQPPPRPPGPPKPLDPKEE